MNREPLGKRQPSVHLLGYWLLSPPSGEFRCWLESQQESRRRRNLELVAKLEQLGVPVSLDEAEIYGRNQVGRPHFARVLCDKGYVRTCSKPSISTSPMKPKPRSNATNPRSKQASSKS